VVVFVLLIVLNAMNLPFAERRVRSWQSSDLWERRGWRIVSGWMFGSALRLRIVSMCMILLSVYFLLLTR
jgi:hypothetical protein